MKVTTKPPQTLKLFWNNKLKNLYFQMCSHNRHRSWIHFNDAVSHSPVHALVFPGAWFRSSAFVLNEKPTGALTSRVSFVVVLRIIKPDSTTPPTRARVNKLSWCQSRIIRILKRTPSKMSHYRIIYFYFFLLTIRFKYFQKIRKQKIHVILLFCSDCYS